MHARIIVIWQTQVVIFSYDFRFCEKMCRHIKNGEPMKESGSAPRTLTADVSWMTSLDRLILARTITNDEASLMASNGITQVYIFLRHTIIVFK